MSDIHEIRIDQYNDHAMAHCGCGWSFPSSLAHETRRACREHAVNVRKEEIDPARWQPMGSADGIALLADMIVRLTDDDRARLRAAVAATGLCTKCWESGHDEDSHD